MVIPMLQADMAQLERARPRRAAAADDAPRDPLTLLVRSLATHQGRPAEFSRTAKLFAAGVPKMAQKLVEEASEVAIEAVRGERDLVVAETADLLYNLAVLLRELEIDPAEVWAEIEARAARFGVAEKLPKTR